jgi:hemerythrin
MTLLQWKPEYSVGIKSMDDEHREMIDLINGLYEQMGSDSDPLPVEEGLGEIFNLISMHFALEERIMKNSKYDEYRAHKDDHEELLDQIRDLMDDFASNPESGAEHLKQGLSDWFGGHFSTFDARLHGRLEH